MKKCILILTVLCLLFSFSLSAMAADTATYTYEFDGMTVTFAADTVFDETAREALANYIYYGDDGARPYNLLCTMFGHKEDSGVITATTHKALAEEPRCLEEYFDATMCTRCEEALSIELIGYCYIYCCAAE